MPMPKFTSEVKKLCEIAEEFYFYALVLLGEAE